MILRDKVCVVAGATGAIGTVVARCFAEHEVNLAVASRSRISTEREHELRQLCPALLPIPLDVGDWNSVHNAVSAVERALGPIDILVNCTGVYGPIGPTATCDSCDWAEAVHTNLVGSFYMLRAVLPGMLQRRFGRIVNFSGGGAAYGRPFFTAYAASKAAIVRLTESVAAEVRDSNVTINAVAPGPVKSRMWEELRVAGAAAGPAALGELAKMDADGGVPAERAAALVLALCSADNRITGRLISAPYDAWEYMNARADEILSSDAGTLRRIALDPPR